VTIPGRGSKCAWAIEWSSRHGLRTVSACGRVAGVLVVKVAVVRTCVRVFESGLTVAVGMMRRTAQHCPNLRLHCGKILR